MKYLLIAGLLVWAGSYTAAAAANDGAGEHDSRHYIERAVTLIQQGQLALARVYLEPALIDYRLTSGERSRAYYLRGYSFFAQDQYVSALRDYNRALEFNPDNPAALTSLGNLHFTGRGVDQDVALAFELFLRAAKLGHDGAQFQVGFAYLEGLGVTRDVAEARRWLLDASNQGNVAAMINLARSYRDGLAPEPDPEAAQRWYQSAYQAGATDALVSLAFMHQRGEFGVPDLPAALALLEQAAGEGSAAAQASLGHLFLTGTGVTLDTDRARQLFERSAAQHSPAGLLGLGHLYETGQAVSRDPARALSLYRESAQLGLLPAQLRLAHALLSQGDASARPEALGWLRLAAAQDSPQAMNDYAWLLATSGDPQERDAERAVHYATAAVAQDANASYLDTLAAAYAAADEFDQAIRVQQQAIAALEPANQDLLPEFNQRLAQYLEGKRWQE